MKEINIARTIANKRKEKGITQDELAYYIGVSKASVSKWETGQSYPDIDLLPRIATYFNISIDELMGYEPQMTKEEIRRLYYSLSADFSNKPFGEVLSQCRDIVKKYFSCFPLLIQIGTLLIFHRTLVDDQETIDSILGDVQALSVRVKNESDDIEVAKKAIILEASCSILKGNPDGAIELLGGSDKLSYLNVSLLASAYQMTGKADEARKTLQVAIYQHIFSIFALADTYLPLCADNMEKLETLYKRMLALAEVFNIKALHPFALTGIYISAARVCSINGDIDKSIDFLEKYTRLVTGDIFPLKPKGDNFFDMVDDWVDEYDFGAYPPRSEKTMRREMADAVINEPAFSVLADEQRFLAIAEKLKNIGSGSQTQ